jgi:hypothetical protein
MMELITERKKSESKSESKMESSDNADEDEQKTGE